MAKEPYLRAEPIQMKLLLLMRRPEADYPKSNTVDMTISLDFYPDHAEFSLECEDRELEPWQKLWAKVTPECLQDLSDFLSWLNSHNDFLEAAQRFQRSFFDKDLHAHIVTE